MVINLIYFIKCKINLYYKLLTYNLYYISNLRCPKKGKGVSNQFSFFFFCSDIF